MNYTYTETEYWGYIHFEISQYLIHLRTLRWVRLFIKLAELRFDQNYKR